MGRMLKLLVTSCVLALASARHVQPELRIECNECIHEMQSLGRLVHGGANDIGAYLAENYCPTIDGDLAVCKENIAGRYPAMLELVVNHYFVDGAIHICEAWGVCMPNMLLSFSARSQDPTPVRSALRDWNMYKDTWRTHSGWLSTLSTWSRTIVLPVSILKLANI